MRTGGRGKHNAFFLGGEGGSPSPLKFCALSAQVKFLLQSPGFQKCKAVYIFEIPFESRPTDIPNLTPQGRKIYYYGEGGIRTLDTLRYTRFPSERTRPLCDLSIIILFSHHITLRIFFNNLYRRVAPREPKSRQSCCNDGDADKHYECFRRNGIFRQRVRRIIVMEKRKIFQLAIIFF